MQRFKHEQKRQGIREIKAREVIGGNHHGTYNAKREKSMKTESVVDCFKGC